MATDYFWGNSGPQVLTLGGDEFIDIFDVPTVTIIGGGDAVDPTGLAAHILDPTPHPAYDEDIPDLVTIFENGLA